MAKAGVGAVVGVGAGAEANGASWGFGLAVGGSGLWLAEVEVMEAANMANSARPARVAGPGGGQVVLLVAVG